MALNSNFRTLTADNIEGIVDDKNYLKSSFENGTITGWTEVAVALTSGLPTGTPTIGSSAASSLALSATSVTPLSGSRSLLVDVPSALTAGHGFISDEFTLDRMDLGKVLTVSFDYERVSGTYNFSGTLGSQTWMVYIYDATAGGATWIQPAGFLGMNQSSGPGRVRATFQSSVTAGQKYRVAVIASQAAAGASSIEFDNFTCSRQTAPIGPVVTDWVSYTPTGTWVSGATYTGKYRRVGDSIQCSVKIAITGAVTATDLQVSIPSGFSIDTAKMASGDFLQSVFGTGHAYDASTLAHFNLQIGYASPTLLFFTVQNQLTGQVISVTNTAPQTWANGDSIHATFMVPVAGASSNVQLSNDTDTRVVAARYTTSTSRTLNNTAPVLLYETLDIDSHSGYNTSTGVYTVPVSGIYRVTGNLYVNAVVTSSSFLTTLVLFKNGVSIANLGGTRAESSASSQKQNNGSTIAQFNAGDQITIRGYSDTPNTLVASQPQQNYFSIERLSGPSVVAASETVACHVETSAGPLLPALPGGAISFPTKLYDTHNAFSGNTYTVPVSGKYKITALFTIVNSAGTAIFFADVHVNGAHVKNLMALYPYANVAQNHRINGSVTLHLNAGQTVQIVGGASPAINLFASGVYNYFCIERVGN